jgi:iron complex transport system substrate-binding protein
VAGGHEASAPHQDRRSASADVEARRRSASTLRLILLTLCVGCFGECALADDARPQRIVSINMCTDELLLRIADHDRIASVTWLSRDGRNANMASAAEEIPANHGLAEEVLSFHPDLVLAGVYTARTTVQLLKRTGIKVVEFGVPQTQEGVRQQIRDVAAAIGETERGESMIAEIDARLAELTTRKHAPPLSAIVLRPNGFTVGKGSLVDDLMRRAGLDNLAAHLGIDNYLQIPLETVALQRADVLILVGEVDNTAPSLATEALHHPVIAKLGERLRVVSLPSRLWTCAGPAVVDAVRLMIDETSPPLGR